MARKRKKPLRAKQMSVAYARLNGWLADDVERRNGMISRDYLGLADIIAIGHGRVQLIQVTTPPNLGEHIKKMWATPVVDILENGVEVCFHLWERGEKHGEYNLYEVDVTLVEGPEKNWAKVSEDVTKVALRNPILQLKEAIEESKGEEES